MTKRLVIVAHTGVQLQKMRTALIEQGIFESNPVLNSRTKAPCCLSVMSTLADDGTTEITLFMQLSSNPWLHEDHVLAIWDDKLGKFLCHDHKVDQVDSNEPDVPIPTIEFKFTQIPHHPTPKGQP